MTSKEGRRQHGDVVHTLPERSSMEFLEGGMDRINHRSAGGFYFSKKKLMDFFRKIMDLKIVMRLTLRNFFFGGYHNGKINQRVNPCYHVM